MKPYPSGTGNPDQALFNLVLSSSKIKIQHAFGGLVSRWRFLWKHLYLLSDERLAKTIYACCVLTDICIDQNDANYPESPFQGFEEFTQRGEEITINLSDFPLDQTGARSEDEAEEDEPAEGESVEPTVRPTQSQIDESKR